MRIYPDEYVKSIVDYDFKEAYNKGKRSILFDIDNTIVPHGAPADDKAKELFDSLKSMGFKLCAVSNNKEPRVRSFCESVNVPYVYKAGKPKKDGYERAMSLCGSDKNSTLFFGDQIFTDIIGAKRAGIYSILVRPIDRKTDEIQIKFKRILEKPIIIKFFKDKQLAFDEYFS